jgi:hypothetical protein
MQVSLNLQSNLVRGNLVVNLFDLASRVDKGLYRGVAAGLRVDNCRQICRHPTTLFNRCLYWCLIQQFQEDR